MRIVSLNGNTFDLDEVRGHRLDPNQVNLTFRNGDEIALRWRDDGEKSEILSAIGMVPAVD